jgi:hypothetical protein
MRCYLKSYKVWLRRDGGLTLSKSNAHEFATRAEAEAATKAYNARCTEQHVWTIEEDK